VRFRDRPDAGRQLAQALARLELDDPVVLALPRGGVPVAFEVARTLGAPLEVFVARKVGSPAHPEFGIGAVAEGGGLVAGPVVRAIDLSDDEFRRLAAAEQDEVARRVERYREGRPLPALGGRDVVLVDDGLATGVTAEAALRDLRPRRPRRLVLAAPVCAADTAGRLGALADGVVCVLSPDGFGAVGRWYECFDQTTDAEVLDLLARAGHRVAHRTSEPGQVRP
jgi:putative phosphoribosyl transferase